MVLARDAKIPDIEKDMKKIIDFETVAPMTDANNINKILYR